MPGSDHAPHEPSLSDATDARGRCARQPGQFRCQHGLLLFDYGLLSGFTTVVQAVAVLKVNEELVLKHAADIDVAWSFSRDSVVLLQVKTYTELVRRSSESPLSAFSSRKFFQRVVSDPS